MVNEEVTAAEKRVLELRIMEFQQACRLIKKDFQSYVKDIIQHNHLVLNNSKINDFANDFRIQPAWVDQMVRIAYLGYGQRQYDQWGKGVFKKREQSLSLRNFEQLYNCLFGDDGDWKWFVGQKLFRRVEDNGVTLLYVNDGSWLRVQGILFSPEGWLMAVFFHKSAISAGLLSYFNNHQELRFYNFEQLQLFEVNKAQWRNNYHFFRLLVIIAIVGFTYFCFRFGLGFFFFADLFLLIFFGGLISYLALWLFTLFRTLRRRQLLLDPKTGLLANFDYYDPTMLVKKYRQDS